MKNNFTEKTKELFRDALSCWMCGKNINVGLSGHHIKKRTSSSPLNLAPLCDHCHSKGSIHWSGIQYSLLAKTFEYLIKQGYNLTDKDNEFISDNWSMYEEIFSEIARAGDNSKSEIK